VTPFAALNFHWVAMRRQIRIEGVIEKLTPDESDRYFQSRPRDSRVGAWSSPQSEVIPDRKHLEQLVQGSKERFGETGEVPCPPFWGGWRVVPDRIEFWKSVHFVYMSDLSFV
jgi:pyridoxamine 5'-phosphate oxidase